VLHCGKQEEIADMNVLSPGMHIESGFKELINAIEQKMKD
jgi:hypothetical protein